MKTSTTKISWTDHTINFWWGCTQVSPACKNCYAAAMGTRFGPKLFGRPVLWGAGKPRFERLQAARKEALKLNANAERCRIIHGIPMIRSGSVQNVGEPVHGVFVGDVRIPLKKRETTVIPVSEWEAAPIYRPRVFVNSMSDWLDDEVPIEWLAYLLETIHLCPGLDFQLLTKRPENWQERILWVEKMARQSCLGVPRTVEDFDWKNASDFYEWITDWTTINALPPNVWIGCTAENQEWANKRIHHLLKIPAKVRFLSCEPLLSPIDLSIWITPEMQVEGMHFNGDREALKEEKFASAFVSMITSYVRQEFGFHWVITGGESGGHARPSHPDWFLSLRDQCAAAGIPFFLKQWGEWISQEDIPQVVPTAKTYQGHKHEDGTLMLRLGTSLAGHLLDGIEHHAFPAVLP